MGYTTRTPLAMSHAFVNRFNAFPIRFRFGAQQLLISMIDRQIAILEHALRKELESARHAALEQAFWIILLANIL
jgi:hypothetical protein